MTKSDVVIKRDLDDELAWDPRIHEADIQTQVVLGTVTLRGSVGSNDERMQAGRDAWRISGVTSVINEIAVAPTTLRKPTDAEIGAAVRRTLDEAVSVPAGLVTCEVTNGWVTLRGEVPWDYQKRAAEDAVRDLAGVIGVSNLIASRIKLNPRSKQADVRQRIEQRLERSAVADAIRINVEAREGTITLRGTVRSTVEREAAERAAWATPGVISVVDELSLDD